MTPPGVFIEPCVAPSAPEGREIVEAAILLNHQHHMLDVLAGARVEVGVGLALDLPPPGLLGKPPPKPASPGSKEDRQQSK